MFWEFDKLECSLVLYLFCIFVFLTGGGLTFFHIFTIIIKPDKKKQNCHFISFITINLLYENNNHHHNSFALYLISLSVAICTSRETQACKLVYTINACTVVLTRMIDALIYIYSGYINFINVNLFRKNLITDIWYEYNRNISVLKTLFISLLVIWFSLKTGIRTSIAFLLKLEGIKSYFDWY